MSGNQARSDKSDYRKPGRSGYSSGTYQRSYINKSAADVGGGSGPPPQISSNRSFKKTNNVQGGQSAVSPRPAVEPPSQTQQKGILDQPIIRGPAAFSEVPKAPSTQSAAMSSDTKSPTTPIKDAPKPIAVQFGSISPGLVNGLQIPARTSSAPPNLDEQKRNQAQFGSFRAVPTVPVPAITKQPIPEKGGILKPVHGVDPHSGARVKKEPQVSSVPSLSLPQKPPVIPISGIPIQIPFHQQQVHLPYGVPNPSIQAQGIPGAAPMHLPLPMHYPMGSGPQMQHQIFMPNLQAHPMQHQGMTNQGQGMSFTAQMGPHMPHQLGNLGMSMPPQYVPQQTGKIATPRKSVVITHPDTREEVKLDKRGDKYGEGGSPGLRPHRNVPSQTIPAYSSGLSPNFYQNSTNSSSYFVPTSSPSVTNAQRTSSSHVPRFNPVSQGPAASGPGTPSFGSKVPISISAPSEPVKAERNRDAQAEGSAVSESKKANSGPSYLSEQSLATNAMKGESPNLGGQRDDAKQTKNVLDSDETSTNLMQNSKSSVVVSAVPVHIVAASTNHDSAPGERGVESSDDGPTTKNPLEKSEEKESARDLPQGSALSVPTSSQLEKSNDIKSSCNDMAENVGNKKDITSPEALDETPTCGHESQSYGPCITQESSGSNEQSYIEGPLVKPASEGAMSSDSPNIMSLAPETSVPSDKGSDSNASLSTVLEPSLNTDLISRNGGDGKIIGDSAPSLPVTVSKDKTVPDQNRPKSASKGKKKLKEMLQKADAAGSTSDLYNAYKALEEPKVTGQSPESEDTSTVMNESKMTSGGSVAEDSNNSERASQSKGEPDDWEDVAEVAIPEAGPPDNGEHHGESIQHDSQNLTKKYSKDFLLKFQSLNYDLPEGFSIPSNVASALLIANANNGHLNRNLVRHSSGSHSDRHGAAMDDDKWSKGQGHFSAAGFRPAQGGNSSVLRNPRQASGGFHAVNHSGPPHPINAMHRNNYEADRWQRGPNVQKGLIPSPQTPSQLMHKAEKKYEVGKVADEEQVKQRRLKAILNKLTPQNFEKLFEQVKAVNIDSAVTLTGVISQIFDKALMEPTFCEMYADFCFHLSRDLPDFGEENEKITFRRVLLNKCQEEFERGEREQEEANRSEDSEITQTKEEREERRVQARRRMLGNIRLIGELFKKKMLTERIMHECINKLLGPQQNPDEEDIEALCKLMSTIGEMIDHSQARRFMDLYFERMGSLSVDMSLSSRVRFMLKDALDLRKNNWQQRRKVEGPKKIEEVHRDAAQERQAQANRLARGPGIHTSGRRGPPQEFSRGSNTISSPNSHSGNFRGYPSHSRVSGNQDVRSEDRHSSFESRTLPVPLRTVRDDVVTLGPLGGLARGMSSRGSASLSNAPSRDRPLSSGESRRTELRHNGNNSVTERPASSSSEDAQGRSASESYTNLATLDRHGSLDRESRNVGSNFYKTSTISPEKPSVEHLEAKALAAIKEFYSAKDEKEVTLCIDELNSPSFYPSMIALWVSDSFERKDMHRELLARLLINLSKPPSGIFSQQDLLKGFESVVATLEDAVNDAPRAPEFLGHILAKSIIENVVPSAEIGRVLQKGGEEPGSLVESGLAGDVLGIILDAVQSEKGESFMKQMLFNANLRLEDFCPPAPMKSKKLDKFMN